MAIFNSYFDTTRGYSEVGVSRLRQFDATWGNSNGSVVPAGSCGLGNLKMEDLTNTAGIQHTIFDYLLTLHGTIYSKYFNGHVQ